MRISKNPQVLSKKLHGTIFWKSKFWDWINSFHCFSVAVNQNFQTLPLPKRRKIISAIIWEHQITQESTQKLRQSEAKLWFPSKLLLAQWDEIVIPPFFASDRRKAQIWALMALCAFDIYLPFTFLSYTVVQNFEFSKILIPKYWVFAK